MSNIQKYIKFQGRGFLVTISQIENLERSPASAKNLLEKIIKHEADAGREVICATLGIEEHKDKGIHVHFAIAFSKRQTFGCAHWKYLFEKQANIQKITWNARSRADAFHYSTKTNASIAKFGERVLSRLTVPDREMSGERLHDYIRKVIEEGSSLLDLETHEMLEVRSYCSRNREQIRKTVAYLQTISHEKKLANLEGFDVKDVELVSNPKHKQILQFFAQANSAPKPWEQPFKTRALYICSKPNFGKTSLVNHIKNLAPAYSFPAKEWFVNYRNNFYWFIYWDEPEFKYFGKAFLKRLLQGEQIDLPIKGSSVDKSDSPLFVMLSNEPLRKKLIEYIVPASRRCRRCLTLDSWEHVCDGKCKDKSCAVDDGDNNNFAALAVRIQNVDLSAGEELFDTKRHFHKKEKEKTS